MQSKENGENGCCQLIETNAEENKRQLVPVRETWGKGIEFLLSCISISVGLGNVWRFPFIALENGGGAFLIPYICVLFLVGRPIYYLEILIGQFSSRGCVKAFEFSPIMKGIGYGQALATTLGISYFGSIVALTIRYLILSFNKTLPWSVCQEEWGANCVDSSGPQSVHSNNSVAILSSSAELFYLKHILREKDSIEDGVGMPNKELVGCLALAWVGISIVLIKGIKSSGKALYFFAIFPHVILLALLVRAVSLTGAMNGIIYFLKPQWNQILDAKVWYAAITQAFFSLAICFGTLMMCGSYNQFEKNVQRDILVVTVMNLITSIVAGCIIFGILGNLAYKTNTLDIRQVVKGGTGLAFISYPDAIAKFEFLPQVFAVLFFLMLLCLSFGSTVGITTGVIAVIKDRFAGIPNWILTITVSVIGFLLGIIYTTPGGQYILNLVDFYGVTFAALVLAIAELIAIGWIYGIKRFCDDIEFMLGIKTGYYWRICWGVIAPFLMIVVLIYMLIQYKPLKYNGIEYPNLAYYGGWTLSAIGILQLPIWAAYTIYKQPHESFSQKFKAAWVPSNVWGPQQPDIHESYITYRTIISMKAKRGQNLFVRIIDNLFG